MPETSRAQCPACSASIADDGYSSVLTCAYCGTRVTVHRPHSSAPAPAPAVRRERTERDLLVERLASEERDWSLRVSAARRWGAADAGYPILAAAVVTFVLFSILVPLDREMEQRGLTPLAACVFWFSGPVAAILIYVSMSRRRRARAQVVAGHRDEALAPLRAHIAHLDRQPPLSEKERRIQALTFERDETRRQLDLAYHRVEDARTGGAGDMVAIPAIGCTAFAVFAIISMFLFAMLDPHEQSDSTALFVMCGPAAALVLGLVVPLVWRPLARRKRVAQFEKERDETAPKLQQRLNELEAELVRLTR